VADTAVPARSGRRHPCRARVLLGAVASVATGCSSSSPSVLDPRSPNAGRVSGLWWLMLWISTAVLVIVLALMAAAIVRRRRGLEIDRRVPRWGDPFIVLAGVIVPAIVLASVFVVSLRDMNAITASGDGARLTVEVVGHDWWWEVRYPGGVETANEIHIPVGQPVRVELTTDDVIHSFWVPQLAPKTDTIPGRTNTMTLQADEPGIFRGQCAEFCGLQHAHMAFFVIAETDAEFRSWLATQGQPAATPSGGDAANGLQVFLHSTCTGCHTIRGTEASGTVGPDLTHVASRQTLAAGTTPNDAASLGEWITDPQGVKPGAVMPPTTLDAEQLRDLVAFLETLG
jgi:cytochrome c oxidase subunit 2